MTQCPDRILLLFFSSHEDQTESEGAFGLSVLTDPYRVLWGVIECFEDLSHLPSGPEVHPEAGHGAAGSQADHTGETTHTDTNTASANGQKNILIFGI